MGGYCIASKAWVAAAAGSGRGGESGAGSGQRQLRLGQAPYNRCPRTVRISRPGRRVLQLAAQVIHVDVHDVGGLRRLQVPDRVEQFDPRHALAAIQHQVLEQRKFLVGEHNRLPAAAGGVVQPVQLQIAGAQLQARLALAPQQGPAAGAQFVQAEGLESSGRRRPGRGSARACPLPAARSAPAPADRRPGRESLRAPARHP